MAAIHDLLERGVPDLIDTVGLSSVLAHEIDFLARRATVAGDPPPAIRARAAVVAGDRVAAEVAIAEVVVADLRGNELTAAAWTVSRVGPADVAAALLERLSDEPAMLTAGDVPLGPRALAEGPLLAATGELAAAEDRLREAVAAGDARAPLWGALARVELGRVLRGRLAIEAVDDAEATATLARLSQSAQVFFRAGGHQALSTEARTMLEPPAAGDVSAIGDPTSGWFVPGPTWTIGAGPAAPVRVSPTKGFAVLHHLVRHPERPVPAAVLGVVADGGDGDTVLRRWREGADTVTLDDEAQRSRVQKLIGRTITALAPAHPLLARHLAATVTTGRVCRYDPGVDDAIRWTIAESSGDGVLASRQPGRN